MAFTMVRKHSPFYDSLLTLLTAILACSSVAARAQVTVTDLYEVGQGNMAMTSQGQVINNQYVYTPYGQSRNLNRSQHVSAASNNGGYQGLFNEIRKPLSIQSNQFKYTGQAQDPSTSLMMLGGFRNYAPGIGQFIQPDTYNSFSNVSINNRYAYVDNNPLAYVDITGHNAWLGIFSGLLAGFAGTLNMIKNPGTLIDGIVQVFKSPLNSIKEAMVLIGGDMDPFDRRTMEPPYRREYGASLPAAL